MQNFAFNFINNAAPAFSNLTGSQSINYGATNVMLSGTLSATGPLYPAPGETITVTINGNGQTTTIKDATGDFSPRPTIRPRFRLPAPLTRSITLTPVMPT